MIADPRRITLVLRNGLTPDRPWHCAPDAPSRVIFVSSLTVLTSALAGATSDFQHDVERIVIDRAASAMQFLELLSTLPVAFPGDVVFVRPDDGAYLSAIGRGGDRLVYSLDRANLRFYLETQRLLSANVVAAA